MTDSTDFPLTHSALEELGMDFFVVPKPVCDRTKAGFMWDAFAYDEQRDVYLYPNEQQLRRKRLYRSSNGVPRFLAATVSNLKG